MEKKEKRLVQPITISSWYIDNISVYAFDNGYKNVDLYINLYFSKLVSI